MSSESKTKDFLLISIKPKFAKKIFDGNKTVELRKSSPQRVHKDSFVLIYVTAPIKELWGVCNIESIVKAKTELLWQNEGEKTGISKKEFNDYFGGKDSGYGIKIKNVKSFLDNSISLSDLKNIIPGFAPPQTYSYIEESLINNSLLAEIIY